METINDKLFVYGSLLHNFKSAIGDFLKLHTRFLGAVYVRGVLFDLGHYPGLVLSSNSQQLVYGHLLQLFEPEQVFITLDKYEGINHDAPRESEYYRGLIHLENNTLNIDHCWTYIYNLPTRGLKEIPGGNYAEFIKHSPVHQRFINSV